MHDFPITQAKLAMTFALAGVILTAGLLLPSFVEGVRKADKAAEVETIPAKLTVHWTAEKRTTQETPPPFRRIITGTERTILDATFLIEVPSIDYWKEPYGIYSFGYAMSKLYGPQYRKVQGRQRERLPESRLISYNGQVSYSSKSHLLKEDPTADPHRCEVTTTMEGSSPLKLEPYGLFNISFKGHGLVGNGVQVLSNTFTVTGKKTFTCPALDPDSEQPRPWQHDPVSIMFPVTEMPGWTTQVKRTPQGLTGTASYRSSKKESRSGIEDSVTDETQTVSFTFEIGKE